LRNSAWWQGGSGADKFVLNSELNGSTNVDKITVFGGNDRLLLEKAIFDAIGGSFSSSEFRKIGSGTSFSSVDGSDRIIYLQSTGALFYDKDGSSGAVRVKFAQLTAGTVLSVDDFSVI
jgi:Ca2+-binding RTX toxin-like protein